jgi:parvulin-like peptidyl-prolyl isomerase
MKKLLIVALAALMLTGCYDVTTKISDPKTVLITLDGATITKGDVYDIMSQADPYPAVVALTLSKKIILEKEVGRPDAVKAEADAAKAKFIEDADDDLEGALEEAGYDTIEKMYEDKFMVEAQSDFLVGNYLNTTYSTVSSTYAPRKARIIKIEKEDDADEALAAIKAGQSFSDVAEEYGVTGFNSETAIYYTGSALPEAVLTFLKDASLPTLSDVIEDTSNDVFYIVQISVADASKIQTEVVDFFKKESSFIELALLGYYESNGFTIYDRALYDMISAQYPDYIID